MVVDARYMMGSMGTVVGEKITRAIEAAAALQTFAHFSASGPGCRRGSFP